MRSCGCESRSISCRPRHSDDELSLVMPSKMAVMKGTFVAGIYICMISGDFLKFQSKPDNI